MRILVANDGLGDVGGVQSYLDCVLTGLSARGHTLAVAYCSDSGSSEAAAVSRRFDVFTVEAGLGRAVTAMRDWRPDLCFSHNVSDLPLDEALTSVCPVVKFMHGYFGTCMGGQKMHAFPDRVACDRVFGGACLTLYFPRRCCRLSPVSFVRDWRWASRQHALLGRYRAIVVASKHMHREYERHGVTADRIRVNPLFPTIQPAASLGPPPAEPTVVFLSRMTSLKGGDVLIRALPHAGRRLGRPIRLVMAGDGPLRGEWQALASRLGVQCTFPGWLGGHARTAWLERASLVAIPSTWPEPFGLVGLEAAAVGVPTVAFDVGGISEWLRDEVNGVLVRPLTPEALGAALGEVLGDGRRLAGLRAGALRVARAMPLSAHLDRLESIFTAITPAAAERRSPALAQGF
jgi:glycosyltransferase involved in cell wall biosynthesis